MIKATLERQSREDDCIVNSTPVALRADVSGIRVETDADDVLLKTPSATLILFISTSTDGGQTWLYEAGTTYVGNQSRSEQVYLEVGISIEDILRRHGISSARDIQAKATAVLLHCGQPCLFGLTLTTF